MTTRPQQPASVDEGKPVASGAAREFQPDGFAVSPGLGPVPAIYVPRPPGQTIARAPAHRAVAGAGRLARGWAAGLRQRVPIGGTMPDIRADLRYSKDHPMDYQIQVITVPVTDVDQAAAFYTQQAGFTLDVDYHPASDFRVVQLTPPGSACSVQIGVGLTDAAPGSTRGTYLAVTNIEAARKELTGRGVKVSDIRHKSPVDDWEGGWEPGADPERRDYASFADPDGNTWVLQEICYHPGTHRD